MELKAPPPDFCITHPNNPACQNVPSVGIDGFAVTFITVLAGFYIVFNRLTRKGIK